LPCGNILFTFFIKKNAVFGFAFSADMLKSFYQKKSVGAAACAAAYYGNQYRNRGL